jgi:hypothetical protein
LARLGDVRKDLERLRAHKLRTYYFAKFKEVQMTKVNEDETLAYEISDYWGKIAPTKSKEAVGEGMQSGMSIHGSWFVIKNPSETLRRQYPDVDWLSWPPAPVDEKIADFVVINAQVLCDDSRQNPYSVRSVKEGQYRHFRTDMPWLRGVFGQSDRCGDYHSTQAAIAFRQIGDSSGLPILEHGYTEPGEGKCVVDMKCGQGKQDLKRDRDAGHDHETAEELYEGLQRRRRGGDFNAVMEMNRSREESSTAPPLPNVNDYQHFEYPPDGSIIAREAHGLGPGRIFKMEDLEKHDQHKLGALGTGAQLVKTSGPVAPKAQLSNLQRKEARDDTNARKAEKKTKKKTRLAEDAAAISRELGPVEVHTCNKCPRTFLTSGALQRHARR